MSRKKYTLKELEELGWYDLLSYMGTPFFSIGGVTSMHELAKDAKLDSNKKVLIVGCGTGYSACLFAKEYGCQVTGIDIAEVSIEEAKERAKKMKCEDKTTFLVENANDMSFEDNTFDVIITMMVSMFLEKEIAYREMFRVLKPGGCFALNEIFKDDNTPQVALDKIHHAENIYTDLIGFQFNIHSLTHWKEWLEYAGLEHIELHQHKNYATVKNALGIAKAIGFWGYFRVLWLGIKLMIQSKVIRKKFMVMGEVKKVLMRRKATTKYLGYVIAIGYKPQV